MKEERDNMTISHTIARVSGDVLKFLEPQQEKDLSAFCYLEKARTQSKNEQLKPKKEKSTQLRDCVTDEHK